MKITVRGRTYRLDPYEVAYTKRIVSRFVKRIREGLNGRSTFRAYLTFLIVLYVLASDALEQMDDLAFDLAFRNAPGDEESLWKYPGLGDD